MSITNVFCRRGIVPNSPRGQFPFTKHLLTITILAILLPAIINAANVHIDATNPNGSITISWSDFEGGFTVNGTFYPFVAYHVGQSVTFTPNGETPRLSFTGTWIATPTDTGTAAVNFVDPGTLHIRNQLSIAGGGCAASPCTITGQFASDSPADLGFAPSDGRNVPANGTSVELVSTYLFVPSNLTFQVAAGVATSTFGSTGTSTNPSGSTSTSITPTITQSVNTATGNQYVKSGDLVSIGNGLHFNFVRSYNDEDSYSGPLCRGWTHSYNILLAVGSSGAVTIKEGDGHINTFQPGAVTGSFTASPGDYDVLAQTVANTYTLTRTDQTVLRFGPVPLNLTLIRLLSITDRNGNTQNLSYDRNGNLTTFTDVGGGIFTLSYDSSNHLTSLKDRTLNRTYSYSCDSTGTNLTKYTDAAGGVTSYSYNLNNQLVAITEPTTSTAVNDTYDGQGRVIQSTRIGCTGCAVCTTLYAYDDVNHFTTVTDPYGHVTTHYYDASLRLVKIVNALGFPAIFTYDVNNNLTSVTNPLMQTTTYTYDSHGNRTSVQDPLGNVTKYVYDGNNNLLSTTDANGNTTQYLYDSHDNLTRVTDAMGGITSFTYDIRGNKLTFINAKASITSYAWNLANRLTNTTDPLGLKTPLAYDAFGRLMSETEPAGNQTTFGYDAADRIVSIIYKQGSLGSAASAVSYTYDKNGNRVSMKDGTGTTAYTFDALNRVTMITFPGGRAVSYSYDCNDNRTSVAYAGRTVRFTYDAINRLIAVIDGSQTTTYSYDAADNVLSIHYSNGAMVSYVYDAASRMIQVQNAYTGSSGNPISSFTYLLDGAGNRMQVTDGAGTVSIFSYDKLYRLVSTTVAQKASTYTYDAVGNRLTQTAPSTAITYSYDAADRLTAAGSTPFAYDKNGNLVSRGSGTSAVTYTYDSADRLTAVNAVNGGALGSFSYDGDGNRVSQSVSAGAYTYLNDLATGFATVLQETGPDGTIAYIRGRGLISADGPTFTYYYHYDAQSTVAGITDTTGHLAQRYVYDVWGNRTLTVAPTQIGTQNKVGYTGETLDPGSSLYYLRARYYDPTIGRFLNKDSFPGFDRNPQTLNRFVYVRNNPATLTDRTGRCSVEDAFTDCDLWPGAPALP